MFDKVVQLYRSFGRPTVVHDAFAYQGTVTPEQFSLISDVTLLPQHLGYFQTKMFSGTSVDLEYSLPASEHGRFFQDFESFIEATPSLNFGIIPEQFYIVDLDYFSGDEASIAGGIDPAPRSVLELRKLCRFIKSLSRLAAENGSTSGDPTGDNRLLFVVAADGKSPAKTLAIIVRISPILLSADLAHMRILELLVSDELKGEIHMEERRTIMRLAIAEVLAVVDDSGEMFTVLVTQWRKVLVKYHHNLLAFVNQYSFEKVRKEIATAQVDHATKLSAVLGDIGGKLLALPVSFGAIVLLRKSGTREEFWVVFAGMIVVSIIFVGILINQWVQVVRIRSSFELIFGQYDDSAFPKKLHKPIAVAKRNIKNQFILLAITFTVFGMLSLLPAAAAIVIWWTTVPLSLIDACILLAQRVPLSVVTAF